MVAFLVFVFSTFNGAVAALENRSIPYSLRTWQTDEGLPQNSVHAIAQTADGFLWVGTEDGLARFDGIRFTLFHDNDAPQLRHVAITSLLATRDGSLWIGAVGSGLTRLKEGRSEHWSKSSGLPDNNVRCLALSSTGSLWIGTDQGLVRMSKGGFQKFDPTNSSADLFVSGICEDQKGVIRVATRNGMWSVGINGEIDEGNFGIGPIKYGLKMVSSDHSGNVWFGGSGGLRYARVSETLPQVRVTDLRQQIISAFMEDSLGQRWVGTFRGIVRMQGDQIVDWPLKEKAAGDLVSTIFEDREGNIWIGGRDGLYRLTPSRFANVTTRQGLIANDVMSICEDKAGALWIASWVGGLTRIQDGKFSQVSSTNGLTDDAVLSLHPARDGKLWVGMDFGRGINKLDQEFQNVFLQPAGLISAPVRAIYEEADGTLWIGTGKGLNVLRNGHLETYTTTNGLAGDNVLAILQDSTGTIWVGAVGGISRWSSNRFTNITRREGLSNNSISALYEEVAARGDARSTFDVWIGTKGGGLNRWHDGKIKSYTAKDGLFSDEIYEILGDAFGCLWMSCRQGIFRVKRVDLDDFDRGKTPQLTCTVFGREDGMETVRCNGTAKPAGWKSSNGQLWFATIRGALAVEPRIKTNEQPPPVTIEEVRADGQLLQPALRSGVEPTTLVVPAGTREIEIHYTALSFQAPQKNRFRYRLEGASSGWVEAETRRVANYPMLRPGRYRFEVTACNNDGVWSQTGASLGIILRPHYWQTWQFKAALVFGAVLFLTVIYRLRVAQLREIERLRIRIASDLHDDVGSRLTKVAMVTESLNGQTPASSPGKSHIENIVRTVRDITLAMDEIVWTINPRNDTLDNLANYVFHYAQDYFQNTTVRCTLDLPPELPDYPISTKFRHNLFMAIKEALNNVLKHAAASEVQIALSVSSNTLTLIITDNGSGLRPGQPNAFHDGILNMKERMRQIGGRLTMDSSPGSGTTITLQASLK